MVCMSITNRRNLEYKSVIKADSVSCNCNFENANIEYICLKITQVYCSTLYWHNDNFKPVVRTCCYWAKRSCKQDQMFLFFPFLKFYIQNFLKTISWTQVCFLNLMYSAHLEKLLWERRSKMSKEEFETIDGLKNGKFHWANFGTELFRNIFLFQLSHPSILLK